MPVYIHPSASQSYKHFTLHSSWTSFILWCYFTNTHTHAHTSLLPPKLTYSSPQSWVSVEWSAEKYRKTPANQEEDTHTLQPRVASN